LLLCPFLLGWWGDINIRVCESYEQQWMNLQVIAQVIDQILMRNCIFILFLLEPHER